MKKTEQAPAREINRPKKSRNTKLARRLQRVLDETGWTTTKLAQELGLSQPYVSQMLNGVRRGLGGPGQRLLEMIEKEHGIQ